MTDEEILQYIYQINKDLYNVRKSIEEINKKFHNLVEVIKECKK